FQKAKPASAAAAGCPAGGTGGWPAPGRGGWPAGAGGWPGTSRASSRPLRRAGRRGGGGGGPLLPARPPAPPVQRPLEQLLAGGLGGVVGGALLVDLAGPGEVAGRLQDVPLPVEGLRRLRLVEVGQRLLHGRVVRLVVLRVGLVEVLQPAELAAGGQLVGLARVDGRRLAGEVA